MASHTPCSQIKKPHLNRDDDDNIFIKKIVIRIIKLIGLIRPEAWLVPSRLSIIFQILDWSVVGVSLLTVNDINLLTIRETRHEY